MKKLVFTSVVFASILPVSAVLAQQKMDDMKGMDMKDMPMKDMPMKNMPMDDQSKVKTHQATGVVKNLDVAKGTVTFAHDPVKSLNWPAMSMTFGVKDKAMLDKLTVGKKFNFEFMQQGSGYVVTDVK